jgi:hypothetical protein
MSRISITKRGAERTALRDLDTRPKTSESSMKIVTNPLFTSTLLVYIFHLKITAMKFDLPEVVVRKRLVASPLASRLF